MQGNYVLFSKSLGGRELKDNTQVTLSSERESLLARCDPIGVSVNEGFNRVTPIVVFTFRDGTGSLLNKGKINYNNIYYLNFGSSMEDAVNSMPLRVASIENLSSTTGKAQGIVYKMTFYMAEWSQLMSVSRNRAWSSARHSDVIRQIVNESGYLLSDIEESRTESSIIQSNIPNNKMIRQMHMSASSVENDDVFEYGCTIDGRFLFRTVSGIVNERQDDMKDGNVPFIVMNNPYPSSKQSRLQSNYNYAPEFLSFEFSENYSQHTIEGGTGFDVSYFDYDSGEYIRRSVSNSDAAKSITDNETIDALHESDSYKVYGGRRPEIVRDTKSRLARIKNSYNKYNLELDFSIGAHIGDVVEIMIPIINPTTDDDLASIPYGGHYIVRDVNHVFNMKKRTKQTRLTVLRQGFNNL